MLLIQTLNGAFETIFIAKNTIWPVLLHVEGEVVDPPVVLAPVDEETHNGVKKEKEKKEQDKNLLEADIYGGRWQAVLRLLQSAVIIILIVVGSGVIAVTMAHSLLENVYYWGEIHFLHCLQQSGEKEV